MDISVFADAANFGPTEDNEPFTAEVFYVMAQNERGERWVHEMSFPGCKRYAIRIEGEEIVNFKDLRAIAKARAEDLAARVRKALAEGGKIDLNYWVETFPAYGSAAYSEEDMIAFEKERELA